MVYKSTDVGGMDYCQYRCTTDRTEDAIMSRVLSEGFELGDVNWYGTLTGATIATATPRSGVGYLSHNPGATLTIWRPFRPDPLATRFYTNGTESYLRACLRHSAGTGAVNTIGLGVKTRYDSFVRWYYITGQSGQAFLVKDGGGTTLVTGTTTISTGTWYLVEVYFKLNNPNGVCTLKVNGYQEGSTYNGNTVTGYALDDPSIEINAIGISGIASNTWLYDDIAVNLSDSSGYNDSWCGDGKIVALTPNGNGDSSQFVGSDGNSTDNYLLVDETPPNTTDYVDATISGYKDLYALSNWVDVGTIAIRDVWVEAYASCLKANGVDTSLGIKTDSLEFYQDFNTPNSFTSLITSGWPVNPATALEWSTTDMDNLQVGIKVTE